MNNLFSNPEYRNLSEGERVLPGDEWLEGSRWVQVEAVPRQCKFWSNRMAPVRRPWHARKEVAV